MEEKMLIHELRKNWIWLAAMLIVPVGAVAATGECSSAASAQASYKGDVAREASATMSDLTSYAVDASNRADTLQSGESDQELSFQSHEALLTTIRDDIDAMGVKLCRLEQIKSALPLSQQNELDAVHTSLAYMANHATYAIEYLKENPELLWVPSYATWINHLDNESHEVTKTLDEYNQYAKVHNRDLKLEHSLGASAGE
jgi:hypothetical protein